MRLLKSFLVVGVILALFQSPSVITDIAHAAARAFTPNADTPAAEQKSYDRLCPLFEVWQDMDADGRQATARTIATVARKQAAATEDPAVAAFLTVLPEALVAGDTARSKAARALIERECRAHQ